MLTVQDLIADTQEKIPLVWKAGRQAGDRPALVALIASGDARQRIHWSEEAREAGARRGLTLDPDGYLAEARLLPPSALGVGHV